ncbi:MAG: chorismate synthase [Bacillales bacterium]|jgi:chorismate synthase|nr:chorismate synthase [Bacillales bacterium]
MRYLTSGESHGPQLTAIIEGIPANLEISLDKINHDLFRRQQGYGRGGRMKIETDTAEILSGVRNNYSLGSPVCLAIKNADYKNWDKIMSPILHDEVEEKRVVTRPRPGHADLVGGIKYNHKDLRNVLERSSGRETAIRVAVGSIAKQLLEKLDIKIAAHVINIGGVSSPNNKSFTSFDDFVKKCEDSPVRCFDKSTEKEMINKIDQAKKNGDTLGGIVEVIVENVPAGLGSYVHYDKKLDGRLAAAIMSINAFKGVEIGLGFECANLPGSKVQDEISWSSEKGFYRLSNNLGGFEGGMTNGMPIVVRGVMKPIPTLYKPLNSIDILTKEKFQATVERSDACAVPAAAVIAESVVAFEISKIILETFEGSSFDTLSTNIKNYRDNVVKF